MVDCPSGIIRTRMEPRTATTKTDAKTISRITNGQAIWPSMGREMLSEAEG
jgi:hypothetical protein